MSFRADGKAECDGCGRDIGNAGIDKCIIVSDLDPDTDGSVRNLHFCRDTDKVKGCARKLLSKANMKAYHERKAATVEE